MSDDSERRLRFVTGPIRDGAHQLHVYNEGLVVFYYDASRRSRIEAASPKILEYFSEDVLEDEKLDDLFADGSLVLQLLAGDGGADLEVVTGNDLTETEKQGGRWLDAQSAWLALPSGRLRVDTYNTAPFSDGDEAGGEIEVPPGDYLLTLHSKDWDGMESSGDDRLEEAAAAGVDVYGDGRIDDVLVLTPLSDDSERPARGILFEERYTAEPEPWPSPPGDLIFEGIAGRYQAEALGDDPDLAEVGKGMEALGLRHVGDFVLDVFGGVQVRGWAGKGLPFTAVASESRVSDLNVDLYTIFDDGTSLTTSNIAIAEDPERGIYRRSKSGATVDELHDLHLAGLADLTATGRTALEAPTSLLGIIKAIDEFLARQNG